MKFINSLLYSICYIGIIAFQPKAKTTKPIQPEFYSSTNEDLLFH